MMLIIKCVILKEMVKLSIFLSQLLQSTVRLIVWIYGKDGQTAELFWWLDKESGAISC